LAESRAERVDVAIIQRNADRVLVKAEIAEGDVLVTEGVQNVRPGAAVRIGGAPQAGRMAGTPPANANRKRPGAKRARPAGSRLMTDIAARTQDGMSSRQPDVLETSGGTALIVRRPVLALVINLLIVVAGLAGIYGAEIRELPDVDRPVITVTTGFPAPRPKRSTAN
jgi:hypothetical protein